MSFVCMSVKKKFQSNGFALSLALKQRLGATRKQLFGVCFVDIAASTSTENDATKSTNFLKIYSGRKFAHYINVLKV